MQKQYLLFVAAFSCVAQIIASDAGTNSSMPGQEAKVKFSQWDNMPEDLKNEIPKELRDQAEKRYKAKEKDKLRAAIDEYYADALVKEFEKVGSIDEMYKAKAEECDPKNPDPQGQICKCSRHRWPMDYSPQTAVEKHDANTAEYCNKINARYAAAATDKKKKFALLTKEVVKTEAFYNEKLITLSKIYASVLHCGNDKDCNLNNEIFEDQLKQSYRENLLPKVFIGVVKYCHTHNIANENELAQIWEKKGSFQDIFKKARNYNDLIEDLIDPVRIKERKAQKIKDLEEQRIKEEDEKQQALLVATTQAAEQEKKRQDIV